MSKPLVKVFTLCDVFIKDANTGKYTLIGIYEDMIIKAFPHKQPIAAFLKVTDCVGMFGIEISVNDPDEKELARSNPTSYQGHPLQPMIAMPVALEVEFKQPGRHAVNLFMNGELVDQLGFEVIQAPKFCPRPA